MNTTRIESKIGLGPQIKCVKLNDYSSFMNEQVAGAPFLALGMILVAFFGLISLVWGIVENYMLGWEFLIRFFGHLLAGLVFFLILIPIHEGIHYVVYRTAGAKNIKFKYCGQGIFQTEALDFPATKRTVLLSAIAPITIISILLALLYLTIPFISLTIFMTAGISHTLSCIGDLAMIVFLAKFKKKEIITIDHSTSQAMCFYLGKSDKT